MFGLRNSAPLARRLKIDDLDAQLAPLDRYGLTGFGSIIADGIRVLASGWMGALCAADRDDVASDGEIV